VLADETLRRTTAGRLRAAGCVAAEEEADELIEAAGDGAALEASLTRREAGEPLAWLTGWALFCGRRLAVEPGVYVPRCQSEGLARRGAVRLAASRSKRAADLCTGTGAVALHLRRDVPSAVVVGVDCDWRAVACAARNGVPGVVGDLGTALRPGVFDVVTAVAPYVPTEEMAFLPRDVRLHEPQVALDGGPGGLAVVRRVVAEAARLLRPGGWLLVEVGGGQDEALRPSLEAAGFGQVSPWADEEGDLRGVEARLTARGPAGGLR